MLLKHDRAGNKENNQCWKKNNNERMWHLNCSHVPFTLQSDNIPNIDLDIITFLSKGGLMLVWFIFMIYEGSFMSSLAFKDSKSY